MVLYFGRRDVARASKSSFVTSMLTALAMCPLEYSSIVRTSSLTTDVSDITCSKASVSMLSNFCCCAVHPRRLHNTAEIIINNFFILFISIYYLRYQSCREPVDLSFSLQASSLPTVHTMSLPPALWVCVHRGNGNSSRSAARTMVQNEPGCL